MTKLGPIYVTTNWLSGKLPDAMAFMTSLKWMDFSTNRLSGKLPDALASWSRLGNAWPCYRGHLGPSGPKLQVDSEFENGFPGPFWAPGPKKSKTESKKSQNRLFSTILTPFRLRFGLFGPRGTEGPGTHFRTLQGSTLGPKGPNDPCSGQKFSPGRGF